MDISQKILSDITIHSKYAKYLPELKRRENWKEIVDRNLKMHLDKFSTYENFAEIEKEIRWAYRYIYDRQVFPSMRSCQFSGKPIEVGPQRIYNCSFIAMDDPYAFAETMFLLLSGCGVGYSVQAHDIDKLPEVRRPIRKRRYLIADSIEGWADAVKYLIYAYLKGASLPEFDFRDIRPKGSRLITSGGKAPGPEPLKECLFHVQKILDRKQDGEKLSSLEIHDIQCFIADCVLAGGIRRASLLSLFDRDDEDMLTCKFGNWFELNPQRGRANNSAALPRTEVSQEDFLSIWDKVKASGSGEPGIYWTNSTEYGCNPCCEIALKSLSFCNLTSVGVSDIETQEELNNRVRAATIIGTLQASYTDFHYLRPQWRKNCEKEALLGVSMTGIGSGKILSLNIEEASKESVATNKRISKMIGINRAHRICCIKPDGNLGCTAGGSSGVHAWHNDFYVRRVRVDKAESIYTYLANNHPELIEDEYFRPNQMAVIQLPQKAPTGSILRDEGALNLLERVKLFHDKWIKPSHHKGPNTHNVSATISIKDDEWQEVGNWLWNNRECYAGISFLPYNGGSYIQAPFEDITEEKYIEMASRIHEIDIDAVYEEEDNVSFKDQVACAGGACELKQL